jgi:collagenase-like PrtC family protease
MVPLVPVTGLAAAGSLAVIVHDPTVLRVAAKVCVPVSVVVNV